MFNTYVENFGNVQVFHLIGSLSHNAIEDVDATLFGSLSSGAAVVAWDCTNLEHVDSNAINHCYKFAKAAREQDRVLVMYALNSQVTTVVELTRLDRVFRVMSSEAFHREYLPSENPQKR